MSDDYEMTCVQTEYDTAERYIVKCRDADGNVIDQCTYKWDGTLIGCVSQYE